MNDSRGIIIVAFSLTLIGVLILVRIGIVPCLTFGLGLFFAFLFNWGTSK